MKRTVLITRPEEDALPLAETLRARDLRVLIEPMLRIKPARGVALDLEGVQALLFTSSNGVRAFAALDKRRDLPVFTTGEASARVARSLGFKTVEGADGDVSGLARMVRQRMKPEAGALFHGAGSIVAGDLANQLTDLGYTLRREVIYEAVQADALSPQLLQKLEKGEVDIVLLFSPRTAETFLTLLKVGTEDRPAVEQALEKVTALCLSPAVAEAAKAVKWRNIAAAELPDLNSMLRLIERTTAALDAEEGGESQAAPADSEPGSSARAATAADAARFARSTLSATPTRRRWVWVTAAIVLLFVGLAALATVPAWQSWTGDRTAEQTALSVENAGTAGEAPAAADDSTDATPTTEDEPVNEATVGEEPAAEEMVVAETAAEEPAAEPVVEEPVVAEPAAEESVAEAPAVEEPAVEEPVAEEPMAEESTATSTEAGAAAVDATESQAVESGSVKTASDGGADRLADIAQRLDAIESRLATAGAADDTLSSFDQRIATLEQGGAGAVSDELASLSERVAGIEQLLIDFMTEVPADSLADVKTEVQRLIDENAGLREQLATLTARFEQTDSTAFMLAVGRLGAALNEGRPFEAELSTLRKLVAADAALGTATPALEILAPYAAEGAPSVAALGARFPDVARAIVQAAQQQGAAGTVGADENGWFDRLIGRISELVTVRPVGDDVEGDGPAARVARAEARLATGDLASAANELDQLEGAPAEAAASWLAAAKARLAVVPAYRTLDSFALDRLGAGAGTAATDAAGSTGSGG